VLELDRRARERLGPDIMIEPPEIETMVARMRRTDQQRAVGEAVLDQQLVAGIGNMWKAEALFRASVSPWRALCELTDHELRSVLLGAHELMAAGRPRRAVYRRAGVPCGGCGTPVRSRPQGEAARIAYWCPECQT